MITVSNADTHTYNISFSAKILKQSVYGWMNELNSPPTAPFQSSQHTLFTPSQQSYFNKYLLSTGHCTRGFPGSSAGKESASNAGDSV